MDNISKDLTVIGAGLSGICAAVMAARKGLRVALIGDRPVLGGNSSSEMRMWTRGATGGENVYSEEMGLLGEMKLTNLYKNRDANIIFWDEVLFDFVFAEENIEFFLNTHIDTVEMRDVNTIDSVQGNQQGSERIYNFRSSVFIDATGDGTVGFLAGADFTAGREGKDLYGERFAPDTSDEYGLGSSLFFQSKESETKVEFIPPDYAYSKEDMASLLGNGGRVVNEHMSGTDFWWLEYGGMRDTIRDNQAITLELKKIVFGIWDYIKNSGKFAADFLTLEWVGALPCKRESRRLRGEYILKQQDLEGNTRFEDGVCYGGWYMDFHPPEGIYSKEEFCIQTPVSVYSIPMRSFYTRNISNLLFSGRTISVTHSAFSSTRIMNTCALNGQAAGMIAAYMVNEQCDHHSVYESHLAALQQDLVKNDMYIPGIRNTDPRDLARKANVRVSSHRTLCNEHSIQSVSLANDFYFLASSMNGQKAIEVKIDALEETDLIFEIMPCESPAGFRPAPERSLKKDSMRLFPGQKQWILLPLIRADDGSMYVKFHNNDKIRLHMSEDSCTGFIGRFAESKFLYNPCFRTKGEELKSEGRDDSHLTNGFNRPFGGTNVWMSGQFSTGRPEWIEFSWETDISFKEVRLYFNPDLSKELVNVRGKKYAEHHGFSPRNTMPPELVKEYRILAEQNSGLKELFHISDNIQRMRAHAIKQPITTRKIRVELLDSWGASYFEVFEVRIY